MSGSLGNAIIKFQCPHCGGNLLADNSQVGSCMDCDTCQQLVEVPAASSAPRSISKHSSKLCPFCAEEINAAAKKCKHCNEFLDGSARSAGATVEQVKEITRDAHNKSKDSQQAIGCLFMVIGVLALLLNWIVGLCIIVFGLIWMLVNTRLS
tara:strand:- start:814 stop:1269 length:456 start_codon:yes stop_codon:yes gene_type:complete